MFNLFKNLAGISHQPDNLTHALKEEGYLPPMKKAIALICYNNADYFSKVLRSILDQKIHGKSFTDLYDLYIFQDGLQDRHLTTSSDEHAKVTELAIQTVGKDHFFLQPQNLGIALHYDFAECFLFEKNDYEFAVFCEHDMILGQGYLHELNKLADKFRGDERIGMMSMHSKKHLTSQEEQKFNCNQYLTMTHSWGFGMYRSTWQEMRPTVSEYLNLISGWPYHQRSHVVIGQWMKSKGFKAVASSQDMVKISVLAELKKIRISLYPNFGFYIGAIGTHFTQAIYDEKKYGESVVYQGELPKCPDLDAEIYQNLLDLSERNLLQKTPDPLPASIPITIATGSEKIIPLNISSNKVAAEDVVAAYKIFLDRLPENMEVIELRVGATSQQLFNSFLTSQEFLDRRECWPAVIKAAQSIVEMNKK
jgi:hypothetical protein